jgi:2-(1,2-epoxy-1,2-dihydrophenyl)acetyl-CoA isomerase
MSDAVLYDVTAGVATITFNRPDAMNAADMALKTGLQAALQQAAEDDAVRAVVLTGSGRAFCVGQDLRELLPLYADPAGDLGETVEAFNRCALALAGLHKPTVAAINGAAAGAGASLAFACDFRYMADTAAFSMAFAKIGLVPDTGASWSLPRLVGYAKALEILTLADPVPAAEAERLGMVTRVVPADSLLAQATAFAQQLAEGPTRAYALTKRALVYGQSATFADALALEAELQSDAGHTSDHQNAIQSFLRKEKPIFDGR